MFAATYRTSINPRYSREEKVRSAERNLQAEIEIVPLFRGILPKARGVVSEMLRVVRLRSEYTTNYKRFTIAIQPSRASPPRESRRGKRRRVYKTPCDSSSWPDLSTVIGKFHRLKLIFDIFRSLRNEYTLILRFKTIHKPADQDSLFLFIINLVDFRSEHSLYVENITFIFLDKNCIKYLEIIELIDFVAVISSLMRFDEKDIH